MAPNSSDTYFCTQIKLTSDATITGFSNTTSPGNFRTILSVLDAPLNPAGDVDGDFECDISFIFVSPVHRHLYAFGQGTGSIAFPDGVGMHLKAGQFLLMIVALQNSGATALSGQTSVSIRKDGAASVVHEGELAWAGTTNLNIPSDNTLHAYTGGCATPRAYQFFSAWPTMNQLGRHQTMRLNGNVVLDTDFTAVQEPIMPLSLSVAEGDQLLLSCSYLNNTGATVTWGESYKSEVCFVGLYRYPLDSVLGDPLQCISH